MVQFFMINDSDWHCHADIRDLKQTDAAVANKQISIQKDSRPIDIKHNQLSGDLPVGYLLFATVSVCLRSLLSPVSGCISTNH